LSYVTMAKKYLNTEIIEKNDGNQVYHLEANNYMYLGKFDEAINSFIYYSKTLKKEDVDIYNNIAICYHQIKDDEKAKEYFRKAAKLGDEMAKKELKKLEQSKN
ncbi:MAG: tetratricopeptide repeat protein, partial [Fusobacteriaceae bacterium]|nr:tetratricopeptide repeat protein [Fusobacteriaceae bacterium]